MKALFRDTPLGTKHIAPGNSGARCWHLAPGTLQKPGKWGIPEKNFQKTVQEGENYDPYLIQASSPHVFCLVK